tara:strand:- start:394 stop:1461 length:1068 start_codon:yes stop_codon:yes gene_type:complete
MSEVKELIEFDKIAAGIADIQEKGNFIPDMSTKEGYNASKRFVLDETTPTRTRLANAHQAAKEYWKVGGQNVDKKKNEILDLLVDIQKPHQDAYKAFDQAEKDKKAKFDQDIQDKINKFYDFKFMVDINQTSSEEMATIIDSCGEIDTVDGFYHKAKEAESAKQETMIILNDCLLTIVNREAEQQREAELAESNRLRQIQIDEQQEVMRLQQERMDAQQAEIEAKQQAQADIELKATQEKNQAEYDRKLKIENEIRAKEDEVERKQQAIEREEYAKKQAEIAAEQAKQAEIDRQQAEKEAQRAADEKRANNNRHATKIKKQAKEFIMSFGVDEKVAVNIVQAISHKDETTLTINY